MAREQRSSARQSMRDRIRARAEEKSQSKGGGSSTVRLPEGRKFVELKKGTTTLSIVPYEVRVNNHPMARKGELWYERTFFIHRNIGADNKMYICPLKTFKKPCPICETRAELMKDWDANEEQIKALKPSERQLFNVDMGGKEGVQVLEMSHFCFGEKLEKEILEGKEEWAGFADLEGGYDVRVRFSETSLGKTTFLEADRIDFEERDDYTEDILDEVVDLDACLKVLEYDQLEKIFLELADDYEDHRDEPLPPTRPGDAGETEHGRNRRRPVPREEEPPFDEDPPPASERPARRRQEPEPEPEPETRPTRRSRAEAPPAKEEEPAPAPASGRRRPAAPEPEPATDSGDACPHGGTWAKDCDTLDACYECKVWEGCRDAKDQLDAAGGGRRKR